MKLKETKPNFYIVVNFDDSPMTSERFFGKKDEAKEWFSAWLSSFQCGGTCQDIKPGKKRIDDAESPQDGLGEVDRRGESGAIEDR